MGIENSGMKFTFKCPDLCPHHVRLREVLVGGGHEAGRVLDPPVQLLQEDVVVLVGPAAEKEEAF